jgi:polyhydroxybutyrate depolymerase
MQLCCVIDGSEVGMSVNSGNKRAGSVRYGSRTAAGALAVLAVVLAVPQTNHSPMAGASTKTTSSGCGTTSPGSTTLTPKVDGFTRTVIVHVPKSSTNAVALPLVLNLHGSGSTAYVQEKFTAMNKTANQDDFIVAYPQGLIPAGNGFDWNMPDEPLVGGSSVPAGSANDVKFLTSLVGILEHDYCVDPAAVYATGISGGAREASQLACDDSTIFAAIAPVSGLRRPTPCPTTRAVPVIAFHGSVDPIDPFDGHGEAYWTYSVPKAAADWARQDGCATKPTVSKAIPDVVLSTYGDCKTGAEVELYEVLGEGHEWPGGPRYRRATWRCSVPSRTPSTPTH